MSLNKEVEVLRDVPLFSKIDHTKLKLLAFTSENLIHEDGQFLFKEGEPGDAAYIVLKGKVSVFIETEKGSVEIAQLKRGDVVGEISILCDVPRTASVKAVESVQTLKVTKDTFIHLLTEFPEIAIEIMRELASRLNKTNIQLREALTS
tara:strand:+ start:1200 stop:1646 length:447 start_codon:yes stop_codon:yes gene_type:complete